ncbi:MAG TPA: hypothetical protein VFN74_23550, partial [Chloroflexota bacterium]|nr:hypothetical protein [Chloroflexota bacterium]
GAWRGVTVGEVWLPWTEDPHDDEARYIRALQSSRRDELIDQLRHQDPPDQETVEAALSSLLNDEAMETLRTGLLGEPTLRYLPGPPANEEETESERQGRFTLASEALPGIRVSILGPSRLREVISKGNPPKKERFLRLFGGLPHAAALAAHEARQREALLELRAESGQAGASTDGKPGRRFRPPLFGPDWVITPEDFPTRQRDGLPWLSERARALVRDADLDGALAAGAALEASENGTSLLLMFRMGEAHLLFTGDAEWGTWQAALEEWRPLLRRTTFFKVGHHGSFNATPRTLVEKVLPEDMMAMVPTRAGVHNKVPLKTLLDALRAKPSRVVLSNVPGEWEDWSAEDLPKGFRRRDELTIEARIPVGS